MNDRLPLPHSANGADPAPHWLSQLAQVARALPYPPTPNLAPAVMARLAPRPALARPRRLAYGLALAVILLAASLAVPSVRAGLLEFLQLGAVRIQLAASPTPFPVPTATGTPPAPTSTPTPEPTPLQSVLDLDGLTTLADARARAPFSIRLPVYPTGLAEPDLAFVQDLDGFSVMLVWLAPGSDSEVQLSLQLLESRLMAEKLFFDVVKQQPPTVELTEVNDTQAIWTTGPYVIITRQGNLEERRLVEGHALIWVEEGVTYRLETGLALDEAIRVAESLEEN